MSTYPFKKRTSRLKVTGIVLAAIVLLAGAGTGAYFIMRQLKPHEPTDASTADATTRSGDSTRLKAEDLLKKNDLPGAKAEYEKATAAYTADNNITAAADTQQQIDIISQTIEKTGATGQTPTPKVMGNVDNPPSTEK